MGRYRKKPVEIEAVQWTGDNLEEIREFMFPKQPMEIDADIESRLAIQTLEGMMLANVRDWIVKGIQGEFYPVKPDIFGQTYEKV